MAGIPIKSQTASDKTESESFPDFYENRIAPHLATYEAKRIKAQKSVSLRLQLAFALGCAYISYAFYAYWFRGWEIEGLLFLGVLVVISLFWWVFRKQEKFHKEIKKVIFPIVVSYYGKDFRYCCDEDNPTSVNRLDKLGLLPTTDKYELGDYIAGSYQDISFAMTELTLLEKSGRHHKTEFEGIVISVDAEPDFTGRILVKRDRGGFSNLFSGLWTRLSLSRVRIDDSEFEKDFEVYASDEVDAYTLLGRGWVRIFKRVAKQYDKGMQACFHDGKLHLLLPTDHNFLEVKTRLDKPISFDQEIATIRSELTEIFKLIEEMGLAQALPVAENSNDATLDSDGQAWSQHRGSVVDHLFGVDKSLLGMCSGCRRVIKLADTVCPHCGVTFDAQIRVEPLVRK